MTRILRFISQKKVKNFGKMAIVATLPVMRSIMMLISEQQLFAESIVVLGISADGNLLDIADINIMQGYIENQISAILKNTRLSLLS
ncbi:MAG: hypothetical protein IPJ37_19225 [Bacteroidales bacterium]|nr:hypothetical protein [Bacteroidales bacterium]